MIFFYLQDLLLIRVAKSSLLEKVEVKDFYYCKVVELR